MKEPFSLGIRGLFMQGATDKSPWHMLEKQSRKLSAVRYSDSREPPGHGEELFYMCMLSLLWQSKPGGELVEHRLRHETASSSAHEGGFTESNPQAVLLAVSAGVP